VCTLFGGYFFGAGVRMVASAATTGVDLSAELEQRLAIAQAAQETPRPKSHVPTIPALQIPSALGGEADGLRSARISSHTPRAVKHSPRTSSTFCVGGPLGEPFLFTHRSGVYYNPLAERPPELDTTEGAQSHLPCAYAVVRSLLDPEEAEQIWKQLGSREGPSVQKFNRSMPAFTKRYPKLVDGARDMKDAFGRYIELPEKELERVQLQDVRCVKFRPGQEVPWHRDDPRSHFVVVVLLSEPSRGEHLEGGTLCVHGGSCSSDSDAMPVHMCQGDAIIYCAPRLDHAVRRVEEGERLVAMFEFALVDHAAAPASAPASAPAPTPAPAPAPPARTGGDHADADGGVVV
jgi:hypothetical protein